MAIIRVHYRDELEALEEHIQEAIRSAIRDFAHEEAKDIAHEVLDDTVYSTPIPRGHYRRGDIGGLKALRNIRTYRYKWQMKMKYIAQAQGRNLSVDFPEYADEKIFPYLAETEDRLTEQIEEIIQEYLDLI